MSFDKEQIKTAVKAKFSEKIGKLVEGEEESTEEAVEESMKVTATTKDYRGGSDGKDTFQVNDMSDLQKKAQDSDYYFFEVNMGGDNKKYRLDKSGKLVEM